MEEGSTASIPQNLNSRPIRGTLSINLLLNPTEDESIDESKFMAASTPTLWEITYNNSK